MSYSFSVQASTKDEAKQKVAKEFDDVVVYQPTHKVDRAAAQAAVNAFIDVLAEPGDGEIISVGASGSLSWKTTEPGTPEVFTAANVTINASVVTKPAV